MTQPHAEEENYWLECVRSSGSNHLTGAFADIQEMIASPKLDERALRRLSFALRALHQDAQTKAERMKAQRLRPWEAA
jgi:hypothetical protein